MAIVSQCCGAELYTDELGLPSCSECDEHDFHVREEFDRVFKLMKAAARRGGVSAAMTENSHRSTLESLLEHVDDDRKKKFRDHVEAR